MKIRNKEIYVCVSGPLNTAVNGGVGLFNHAVCFPEIAASFATGVHFNTFGGNPLVCAVASSVLDVSEKPHRTDPSDPQMVCSSNCCRVNEQTIQEEGTQQLSHEVGTYLLTQLAKLRDKYEIIGDVRGKGLMIGVEMVKDKVQ